MPDGDSNKTDGAFSYVDLAAKTVAVAAAFSVLLGVTYNVTFFAIAKPEWLFYLSATDNLAGTLFALPIGMVAVAVQLVIMGICHWGFRNQGGLIYRIASERMQILIAIVIVAAFLI